MTSRFFRYALCDILKSGDEIQPYDTKMEVMQTRKYEIILYWSEDDQAVTAEVPELPGCAADGSTYQEALQNVEVIIQEWIKTAQELGRPIPKPRGRLIFA